MFLPHCRPGTVSQSLPTLCFLRLIRVTDAEGQVISTGLQGCWGRGLRSSCLTSEALRTAALGLLSLAGTCVCPGLRGRWLCTLQAVGVLQPVLGEALAESFSHSPQPAPAFD